jgi:hypothetical protein
MNFRISELKQQLATQYAFKHALERSVRKKRKENRANKNQRTDLKNSALVLEYLIEKNYGTIVELFEDTLTAGLQQLFREEYEFLLDSDRSGDHTNCEFQIATNECPYYQDLRMTQGKSIQEIIACLLRVLICYLDNNMPSMVILDEPFGGNRDYRQEEAHAFLNKISKEFGIQIIMVTQNQKAVADHTIDLSKKVGKLIC